MSTTLNRLMAEFAEKYGSSNPELTQEGCFEWHVDGRPVRFFESTGNVYMDAGLRKLPEDKQDRGDCIKIALQASLANADSYADSLYIEVADDTLCLYRCVPAASLSLHEFEGVFESFMHSLECLGELTGATTSYGSRGPQAMLPYGRL
ncbi:hypothetical protein BTA51_14010 [Hahella sp. CCB-MM4]|uniref:CesT family type III secretion system chaperone n=1 Tax=Hahella sp. (strain CCB-MM4) TaxID=1926491 RepID=UPI000B9B2EF7|nr:CesT family type III secretion system chaperone [Hahella sp. CCB-MM4]OZG72640.1 hypothetical protein BTA51_14010 [Hahella sp. CCB-MM4]